jgi:3-methyladenine DNA glycosylase AlkC
MAHNVVKRVQQYTRGWLSASLQKKPGLRSQKKTAVRKALANKLKSIRKNNPGFTKRNLP